MSNNENILKKIKDTVDHTAPKSELYLYGSRARGNAQSQSDWDILILLNEPNVNFELEKKFIDALYDVEIETGAIISPLIYTKLEWKSRYAVTPLFENITREGIRIK